MSDTLIGRNLGHYELREEIGRGGMAVVYRASQPRIERDVAIKIIAAPYASHPAFVRRFEQEMRAAVKLQHPHILPVYDVSLEDHELYMVMAYLPGGTLSRRIAASRSGLPLDEAICIVSHIASALDYAHTQHVIHRDVKPGNILLDGRGNAYLGDFGIAQVAEAEMPQPLGTFAYMAPELLSGRPATPASDIYSLAIVAFEMLAGQRPFEAHNRVAVTALHAEIGVPDIRPLRPDLPSGIQVALAQALAHDPASRPRYASSLAGALLRASGLTGLPCADLSGGAPAAEPEAEEDDGYVILPAREAPDSAFGDEDDNLDWDDPRTPPPFGDAGWDADGPDTEPESPVSPPPPKVEMPPTQVAAPTAVPDLPPAPPDKNIRVSLGPALLLIWAGIVLVLLALAVIAVVLISRSGLPAG